MDRFAYLSVITSSPAGEGDPLIEQFDYAGETVAFSAFSSMYTAVDTHEG